MKKNKTAKTTSLRRRIPRSLGTGLVLAMVLLTVGVVAGLSRQPTSAKQPANPRTSALTLNEVKVSNQETQVVPQVSQIKPLTQEEAQKLATALKVLANQSSDGLQQVRHADGSLSMDLQGHFQNVALAKRNEDGTVAQSCVDNPAAGAAFFGIDPKLVGVKTRAGASPSNPRSTQK